jgi:hypothetical protein
MCFGENMLCQGCQRPTIYLLPGVRRCTTRGKLSHIITGPTTTTGSCWQCRENPTVGAIDEKAYMHAWYEKARLLLGYEDLWREAECHVEDLTSEIKELSGKEGKEEAVSELEKLKKKAEDEARGYAISVIELDKWMERPTAPVTVIVPPFDDELVPKTFKEWTESPEIKDRQRDGDVKDWQELIEHCRSYELYLRTVEFEYQLDKFRQELELILFLERKIFDFNADNENELLGFRQWVRKERLGVLKNSKEVTKAESEAEKHEHVLDLYATYLKDASAFERRVFDGHRSAMAQDHRRQLNELKLFQPEDFGSQTAVIQAPPHPVDEIENAPMTFAEWCSSPLARQPLTQTLTLPCALISTATQHTSPNSRLTT